MDTISIIPNQASQFTILSKLVFFISVILKSISKKKITFISILYRANKPILKGK